MIEWIAVLVCTVAGYAVGRVQPWKMLRDEAWWYATTAKPDQASKVWLTLCLALWADRVAAVYWRRWRRRNDPPRRLPQMREDKP